ncbi:SpoIIE family protein phosphatase [Cerasicoccus arenae]|uniref:SpoIIE family protein phosphatase n=1 Tax=Cerasicoccus arenae TaxID=424488 RepID=UPI00167BAB5B|nr:SpoIIE family protein phosphatase [Cerasicoccus arenae]MBK1857452.1 SpoIIE family protein phosphatase [Cerasicoccus arenae]
MPARLGEVNALREHFSLFLADMGLPPMEINDWQLALTEIFANAVTHGCQENAKTLISVSWESFEREISLSVIDPGNGPPKEVIREPRLPSETATHGRGLYIVHKLVDRFEHWQSSTGYCCKITRRHDDMNEAHSSEALMDKAMTELSTCYESLAAFYRLGEALVESETVVDFLKQAVADIQGVAPHNFCRIYLGEVIQSALLAELALSHVAFAVPADSLRIQFVMEQEEEYSWTETGRADDPNLDNFRSGIICPVIAAGRVCGALMLANHNAKMELNAAVRHTVRTFADLIGIAVMNASNAQIRDRENKALRELEIASEMQDKLLPLPSFTSGEGWSAFVRRRSAQEVSGDHVEICETRGGDIIFCMIDVMGKGVPAAFLAAMFRTALHISVTFQYSLVGLMMALNRTLCRELEDMTMFATCAIARVPKNLRKIEIVNAGHCPVLGCIGEGEHFSVEPSGPPLGLFKDSEYSAERFSLSGPARVLMVTDGLFEWARDGEIWGWKNFTEFLMPLQKESPETIWKLLRKEIDGAHVPANDDQTFLYWQKL